MNRTRVTSSNIAEIGYDEATSTLEVAFLNGSVYQYFDVPKQISDGLMQASSHGEYLAQYVKGHYRYSKV